MKKLKKIALGLGLFLGGFFVGLPTNEVQTVEVDKVIFESTESFIISDGEIGVEFKDGSWASVDTEKNHYEFTPVELGDWSYEFNNISDLKKCIKTYVENK